MWRRRNAEVRRIKKSLKLDSTSTDRSETKISLRSVSSCEMELNPYLLSTFHYMAHKANWPRQAIYSLSRRCFQTLMDSLRKIRFKLIWILRNEIRCTTTRQRECWRNFMQNNGTISRWIINCQSQRELQYSQRCSNAEKARHSRRIPSAKLDSTATVGRWNELFIMIKLMGRCELEFNPDLIHIVRSPQMAHQADWRRPGHSLYSIESEYKIHDYSMDIYRIWLTFLWKRWDFEFGTKSNVYEIAVTFCTSCIQTDDSMEKDWRQIDKARISKLRDLKHKSRAT
jgi:hypothetical protein